MDGRCFWLSTHLEGIGLIFTYIRTTSLEHANTSTQNNGLASQHISGPGKHPIPKINVPNLALKNIVGSQCKMVISRISLPHRWFPEVPF